MQALLALLTQLIIIQLQTLNSNNNLLDVIHNMNPDIHPGSTFKKVTMTDIGRPIAMDYFVSFYNYKVVLLS